MANTVDNRIVEMQFNNQQFERNINKSILSLDRLKQGLNLEGATRGIERIEQTMRSFTLDPVVNTLDSLNTKFDALSNAGVRALNRIKDQAIDAGVAMMKSLSVDQIATGMSKYEAETQAIATMQYAIDDGKTAEGTARIYEAIEKLQDYSDETSYSFSQMVDNMGKFIAAGVGLEDAEKSMEGIANWAAMSGVSAQSGEFGRALYNLSQAMGQGTVKVMDWMSIENAHMATKRFKQQVIDIAKQEGKLVEVNGKLYASGVKITEANKEQHEVTAENMRSTLADGWFTADVLKKVLGVYADSKEAFLAAQQARTFTDAIEAAKDAVSSGWSRSFRLVFGDIDEATEFFTDLANAIIEVTDKISGFRNAVLETWRDNGGREAFLNAFWNIWNILKGIARSFEEAFGLTAEGLTARLGTGLADLTKRFEAATASVLGLFESIKLVTGGGTTSKSEKTVKQVTGDLANLQKYAQESEVAVRGMINTGSIKMKEGTVQTFTELADAYKELNDYIASGDVTAEGLEKRFNNIERLNEKASKTNKLMRSKQKSLKAMMQELSGYKDISVETTAVTKTTNKELSEEEQAIIYRNQRLIEIFTGLKDFFGIFSDALGEAKKGFADFVKQFNPLVLPVLNVVSSLAAYISQVRKTLKANKTFKKQVDRIRNSFAPLTDYIGKAGEKLNEFAKIIYDRDTNTFFNGPIGEKFQKVFSGAGSAIDIVSKAMSHMTYLGSTLMSKLIVPIAGRVGNWLLDKFASVGDWITRLNKALEENSIFQKIRDGIDSLGAWLDENLDPYLEKINNFLSPITTAIENFFGDTGEGIIAAIEVDTSEEDTLKGKIALRLQAFENAFSDNEQVQEIVKKINEFFDPIKKALEPVLNPIKAFFGDFWEGLGEAFTADYKPERYYENLDSYGTPLDELKHRLQVFLNAFGPEDGAEAEGSKGIIATVVDALKGIFAKISELATSGSLSDLLVAGAKVFLLVKGIIWIRNFMTAANIVSTVGDIIGSFQDIMDDAWMTMKSSKWQSILIPILQAAASIWLLADSLVKIASLNWEQIGAGLAGLGGIMAEDAAFMLALTAISKFGDRGILDKDPPLLKAAMSIMILGNVMKDLSQLGWEDIAQGLVGMGGIFLENAAFMLALTAISKFGDRGILDKDPPLLKAAMSIMILGNVMKDLSQLGWDDIAKGLVGMGGIFLEGAVFIGAITAISKFGDRGILDKDPPLLKAAMSIMILGNVMKDLSQLGWEDIAKGLVGMGGIFLEGAVFMTSITAISAIGDRKFLDKDPPLLKAAMSIMILGNVMKDLSQLGWEDIAKGLVGMGGIFLENAIFMGAITAISKFGDRGILDKDPPLITAALAVKLLGETLLDLSKLKWDEIAAGLKGLGGIFAETGVFMGILEFMGTKDDAIGSLGRAGELMGLGQAIGQLGDAVVKLSQLNTDEIKAGLAGTAGILTEMLAYNFLGDLGDRALDKTFGPLGGLKKPINSVSKAIQGISFIELAVAVDKMSTGVEKLAKLAKSEDADLFAGLFAETGLLGGVVIAANTLGNVSIGGAIATVGKLGAFIAGFEVVFTALGALTNFLEENGIDITGSIEKTGEVLANMGNAVGRLIGGFIRGLQGKDATADAEEEVGELTALSGELQKFADACGDINFANADRAIKTLEGIAQAANLASSSSVPSQGNMTVLAQMATELGNLGGGLTSFSAYLNDLNFDNAEAAVSIVKKLIEVAKTMATTSFNGENGIGDWSQAITNMTTMLTQLTADQQFGYGIGQFGASIINGIAEGLTSNASQIDMAIFQVMGNAVGKAASNVSDFVSVGENISIGLGNGVYNESSYAYAAVETVVSNMLARAQSAAVVQSPSKVTTWIGEMVTRGLGVGVLKEAPHTYKDMETVVDGMLGQISTLMASDISAQPTIRPVLDLTDITTGVAAMNGMLPGVYGMRVNGIMPTLSTARANAISENQPTAGSADVVNAVNSLAARLDLLEETMSSLNVVLDTGATVGGLAPAMNKEFGSQSLLDERNI